MATHLSPVPTGSLAERVLAGEMRAVARAITLVENEDSGAADLVSRLFSRTGGSYLVGVTGPPGAGKSTLVDRMTAELRAEGKTVGVIAVDPTSPFSGGAILGDRVRMQAHAGDAGVFIRSMATRGHLGGLARATSDVALILDASGKDLIIIETVGVGQDEVEIVRTADVAIVVLVPGTGDEVQALKAGIMEIADVFVVNKADREGAERAVSSIEALLSLESFGPGEWRPPILKTVATEGNGVADLIRSIDRFRQGRDKTREGRRRSRCEYRLREILTDSFLARVDRTILAPGELESIIDQVLARTLDPYTAAERVMKRALGG